MKNINILLFIIFASSCISISERYNDTDNTEQAKNLDFKVTIQNNTLWDISIISENKDRMILKGKKEIVTLPVQKSELSSPYEITCYVNLTNDVIKKYSLIKKVIKNNEKSINFDQNNFECDDSYFVIKNSTDSVIKVIRPNSITYRAGLGQNAEGSNSIYEIRKDQSNVYESENFICSVENENRKQFMIPQKIKKGWIDYFTFDGSAVTLTDSRPIHRVGENSWVEPKERLKELKNATNVMPLVTDDGEIYLFASTEKELIRYVFDSAGNVKKQIKTGDSINISYVATVNDGFFITGNKKVNNNNYKAYARVLSVDGSIKRPLQESKDYEFARYFTAAQNNDTWLLAGDTGKIGLATAYARLVKDDGNRILQINEWGENNFPKNNGKHQCGDITAVTYNKNMSCWLITGELINETYDGFYLAQLNNDKTIQILDSFKDMEFYKILVDDNSGAIYLAGLEYKENKTFATLIKWDTKIIWKLLDQPPSNSFYFDAIFDTRNNSIVLVGTLDAKNEYGKDGKPFIEAVDMVNEKLLWRETLSDSEFNETNLVTAITLAPYYGYVLSLSHRDNNYENKPPFKIGRVNSQGKLKKF